MHAKRGRYFKYLQNKRAKIPRQTRHDIRKREKQNKNVTNSVRQENNPIVTDNLNISVIDNSNIESDISVSGEELNHSTETIAANFFSESNVSIVDDDSESHSVYADVSISLNDTKNVTNFEDDENETNVDFLQRIHEKLQCTKGDAMSMIYSFAVRHNLNWTATLQKTWRG